MSTSVTSCTAGLRVRIPCPMEQFPVTRMRSSLFGCIFRLQRDPFKTFSAGRSWRTPLYQKNRLRHCSLRLIADDGSIERYPSSVLRFNTHISSELFPSHTFQTSCSIWIIVIRARCTGSLPSYACSATLAAPPHCRVPLCRLGTLFSTGELCLPQSYVSLFPKPPPIDGLLSQF